MAPATDPSHERRDDTALDDSPTTIPAGAGLEAPPGLWRGPAAYRPRTPWPLGAAVVAAIGIIVFAMAAGLTGSLVARPAPDRTAAESLWPFVAALAASQLSAIVLTLLAARAFSGRPVDVLALGPPPQGPTVYPLALAIMLVVFGLYSFGVWLVDPAVMAKDVSPFVALVRSPAWWLALIAIAVGAPLMEELVFRGFLLSALAQSRVGFLAGSVVTSLCWTALHASYSVYGLVEVFAVGLYFSWLLWRTGSLRVPIFCHAAYNAGVALFLMLFDLPSPVPALGG